MTAAILAIVALAAGADTTRTITLQTPTGALEGTLLLPTAAAGSRTVALVIAGSGPTDRDGNSAALGGGPANLRLLAEALAARGVASLRYDKRGIGASAGAATAEVDLRFSHYVDDAVAWVEHLRSSGEHDRTVLVGHSEGALIAILAAGRAPVDALVLVSPTGRPLGQVLRDQLAAQLPPALLAQAEAILVELEAGRSAPTVPPVLAALFRPSVQPFLMEFLAIDPVVEIARIDTPILVVTGSTDLQVSADRDARPLAAASPRARLVVVEGMNHVLKSVSGGLAEQTPSYIEPDLPLADGLVDAIGAFLEESR